MRHAWTRLFGGVETFLMKRKKFFENSFLVQILIKCGTWWPISKIGNPERPDAINLNTGTRDDATRRKPKEYCRFF